MITRRGGRGRAGLWIGLAVWAGVAAFGAQPLPDKHCLDCHEDKELTKTNETGRVISLYVDAARLAASVHGTNRCVGCHADLTADHPDDEVAAKPVDCAACHALQSESYGASVHALALQAGDAGAATCVDCHGTHAVMRHTSPESPLHFSRLAATCGECHPEAARDVAASVHGEAVAAGDRLAPTCTDCHAEHQIEGLKGASALKLSGQVCGKCHASERINTRLRLGSNRVKTFFESYHGLAVQGGSAKAANCASCHGYHKILPSTDPRSSIHKDHLIETCGQCHPGATANFALGRIHTDDAFGDDTGAHVNWWVRHFYIAMIVLTVGFLSAHNGLSWVRKALAARRAAGATVLRLDQSQRVQHAILLVSFVVLALSGFALKYPDSWLAWLFGADENVRRWIHRVAGVVLLGIGAWHVVYVVATVAGRRWLRDIRPAARDWRDIVTNARYLTGRTTERARFGRFGYPEKFEYWAVLWGSIIMGVTGLMIWFKMDVTRFLPRWAVDVAITVHYYEAILACLSIAVWHFYHVVFDPEVYPMNWAWWDGHVSKHWYLEEHGLDPAVTLEDKAQNPQTDSARQSTGSRPPDFGGGPNHHGPGSDPNPPK